MSTEKDSRLVDYLYGELSDEEADAFERELESNGALSSELGGLEETLQTLRSVEAEDPSPHLDSLILAHARQVADEVKQKRGWLRRLFASPLAGLVAAGSVAMIAALVSVPSMMMTTSEEAPTTMERTVEQIPAPPPAPVVAAGPEAEPQPSREAYKGEAAAEADEEAKQQAPKKLAKRRASRVAQDPKPKAQPAKPAAKLEQKKLDDSFSFDESVGDSARDGLKDTKTGAASGPAVPPAARPPAPPAETPPEPKPEQLEVLRSETRALERSQDKTTTKEAEGRVEAKKKSAPRGFDVTADAPSDDDENLREERGRSMLLAASEEFKRGNPEGGRQVLIRALSVVRNAPVHAEIAFRLAQYDLSRGAWGEALRYARIAASAPRFDKRKAAMEIVVEAEKRLREERPMDQELAPAAPSADTDEAR